MLQEKLLRGVAAAASLAEHEWNDRESEMANAATGPSASAGVGADRLQE
jgi:hypothetical protein